MIATHGIPLSLYRDRHSIFQRNMPTAPRRTTRRKTISHSARTRSRPTRHRTDPRLLSPSQGPHRARLAHLPGPSGPANFASPTPPPCPLPTPCSTASAPITTGASPVPPPRPLATFAPCPAASISPGASLCTIHAWSHPITPSPWARLPLPCLPCPAIAALRAKPSNSRINWRACCAPIAGMFYRSLCRCRSKNTPNAALHPAAPRRKEKPDAPDL